MKNNKNCTIVKRVRYFRKFFLSTSRSYTYKFRWKVSIPVLPASYKSIHEKKRKNKTNLEIKTNESLLKCSCLLHPRFLDSFKSFSTTLKMKIMFPYTVRGECRINHERLIHFKWNYFNSNRNFSRNTSSWTVRSNVKP